MNRERKVLFVAIGLAATGWAAVTFLAASIGALKADTALANRDAKNWQRQAGKAYTELLAARSGGGDRVLIPKGAHMECTMAPTVLPDNTTVGQCRFGTTYPPDSY